MNFWVPPRICPLDSQNPPMTPKQYRPSTLIFSTDVQAFDFSLEDSPGLYCCVFSVIFVWDKIFFEVFFVLVQLVYHGSSHATLHMCTACSRIICSPFTDTPLAYTYL